MQAVAHLQTHKHLLSNDKDKQVARIAANLLTSREEGGAENLAQHCVEILNPPTHMEIAIMLNLSRETVTRVFQTLQNRQIVRRAGATTLIVENPALLKQFADGSQELG